MEENKFIIEEGATSLILKNYVGNDDVVEIPEGVEILGIESCSYKKMTKVIIPHTVYRIGMRAFKYCENLKQVVFLSGDTFDTAARLTTIREYAFYNCYALEEVILPDDVEKIDDRAFANCHNLKKVSIPSGCKFNKPYQKIESGVWTGTYEDYPDNDDRYFYASGKGAFPEGCEVIIRK